jgi:hypothetical protein
MNTTPAPKSPLHDSVNPAKPVDHAAIQTLKLTQIADATAATLKATQAIEKRTRTTHILALFVFLAVFGTLAVIVFIKILALAFGNM